MPQVQLPLFPLGTTHINAELAFARKQDRERTEWRLVKPSRIRVVWWATVAVSVEHFLIVPAWSR